MKSYFLEAIHDAAAARQALSELLPAQAEPWILMTADQDDAVAYLDVQEEGQDELEGPFVIQADVSGRHYNKDENVIDILRLLQKRLGGVIRDDFGNVL